MEVRKELNGREREEEERSRKLRDDCISSTTNVDNRRKLNGSEEPS